MLQQMLPYPDWMKSAFDERINQLAHAVAQDEQIETLRKHRHDEILKLLRSQLSALQVQLLLD